MSGGTQDVAVSAKFEALVQRLVGLGCSIVPKASAVSGATSRRPAQSLSA